MHLHNPCLIYSRRWRDCFRKRFHVVCWECWDLDLTFENEDHARAELQVQFELAFPIAHGKTR